MSIHFKMAAAAVSTKHTHTQRTTGKQCQRPNKREPAHAINSNRVNQRPNDCTIRRKGRESERRNERETQQQQQMKAKRSKQGEKSKQARNKPGVCLCACLISATSVATHRLADSAAAAVHWD